VWTAGAWADLYERLMNIAARSSSMSGRGPPFLQSSLVKFEFGKQAEVIARVEIEMGHHPVHDVPVLVLGPGAKHPVVVILVTRYGIQIPQKATGTGSR
jgi:hypothetical protein